MKSSWPKAGLTAAALTCALAMPGQAQEKSNDDLMKEMESLRQMLQAIQKDLQEVKGMLSRQAQAPAPTGIGTVLDLGGAPVKGEKTAKLTLVEFSDYQ
jgi:protein-disulfide isomerase